MGPVTVLAAALFAATASAEDPIDAIRDPLPPVSACDSIVDLREPGGSMYGIDGTAQGYTPTNLCGFFTFANYLDAYRISRNDERGASMARANPIAIGVENALRRNIPFWVPIQNSSDPLATRLGRWGSTFCALARATAELGYCADAGLPSKTADETAKFSDVTTFVYGELLEIAEALPFLRKTAIDRRIGGIYEKYLAWAAERRSVDLDQSEVRALIEKNATKPYETIRAIFLPKCALASKRGDDFRFGACKGELYLGLDATGIETRKKDPWRTDRALRRIVELLDRPNPMPVPFSYCSAVLRQGKFYSGKSPVITDGSCGLHWSLIIGRRRIGKDCFLLVHNSWKPSATYSKDWMVDRGAIWVREQELARSMVLLQWLED